MEKEKIKFKPLHEGMGFHPFTDGLPYAPESKSKTPTTGTGATAAGRPQFATENMTARPLGTARQLQQQNQTAQTQNLKTQNHPHSQSLRGQISSTPVSPNIDRTVLDRLNKQTNATASTAQIQAALISARAQTTEATDLESQLLRRRVFAYLMDTVIHSGFWLATNLTALLFFKFQIDSDILKTNFFEFLIFFSISQWMFIALQEMLFENSIGKVFFNLEFKRNHSSLLLRSIVFMLGVYCLGLGFIYRPQDKLGKIQMKSKIYGS
jgi:hypothetical protein